jgi:hypothetical protein
MTELPMDPEPELTAAPPPQRQPRRGPRSQATREPMRDPSRDGVWYGRNGEILSRQEVGISDPFDVPMECRESGWEYQWNAVTVNGSPDVVFNQNSLMYQNGWRPVPADRPGFAGRYAPHGATGAIIYQGLRLDERPKAMCDEARADDYRRATGQMRDRDEALMGHKANLRGAVESTGVPLSPGHKKRGARHAVSMSIDPALDAPVPQYEYE